VSIDKPPQPILLDQKQNIQNKLGEALKLKMMAGKKKE
jgi:uncharacterized protein Veg